jgi:MGT family glycosyltransferase
VIFNFLLASRSTSGNLSPLLTAGRRLRSAGHRVRVIADPAVCDEVEADGFGFVPWKRVPVGADADVGAMTDLRTAFRRSVFVPLLGYAEDVADECQRVVTDVVLSIDVLFGAALGAEYAGVGLAMLSPHVSVKPLPGVPPGGSGLKAPETEEERAEVDAAGKRFAEMLNQFLPEMNAARAALGLTPFNHVLDIFDRADRVLLATSRAFDFPADYLPNNTCYVGPLLDEPGWSKPWQECWLHGSARPRALISFSTDEQGQRATLQRVVDAIGTIEMEAVVTTGPAFDPDKIQSPKNVKVFSSAPHNAVMQKVSLVVTHGGHGTVNRALMHGLPLLVIPNGRDQKDNAIRVEARGAGLVLPGTASAEEIAAAIKRLFADPRFRVAARQLGDAIALECKSSMLVDEMETVAAMQQKRYRIRSVSAESEGAAAAGKLL